MFIRKAPGSQYAQTSWTENPTVHRRREFLACPVALKITTVLLWRYSYFQSFVPTSVQKYRFTHTPDLTAFSLVHERIYRGQDTPCVSKWKQFYHSLFLPLLSWFDRAVWTKRDASMTIKKKHSVKSHWMIKSHILTLPSVLQHFSQKHPVIVLQHHLLFTIALFSSEISLCLKIHSGLVSWSFHVICYTSNVIMLQAREPAHNTFTWIQRSCNIS